MSELLALPLDEIDPSVRRYILRITTLKRKPAIGKRHKIIRRRNEFIKGNFWRPQWQAEMTTAVAGLHRTMEDSYEYHGLKVAADDWVRAHRYRGEASDAFLTLQEVRDPTSPDPPEAEVIQANSGVLMAMAEYLWATSQLDALDRKNYQAHRTNRQPNPDRQDDLEGIVEWINESNDGVAVMLWQLASASEGERLRTWDRELERASRTKLGEDIVEYLKTVSSQIATDEDVEEYLNSFPDET